MPILSDLNRGLKNGFKESSRALGHVIKLVSRSYKNGIKLAYKDFGGEQAISFLSEEFNADALNKYERFLHRTVSFAWLFGGIAASFANTFKNTAYYGAAMTNLILHQEDQINYAKKEDKRHWAACYVMGFPGLVFGLAFGSLGFVFATAGRVVTNSLKSFGNGLIAVTNLALPNDLQVPSSEEKRSFFRRNIVGLPGRIVGSLIGGLPAVGVLFVRSCKNSALSFYHVICAMTNVSLPNGDQINHVDNRSFALRYILGLPGIGVGLVVGAFSSSAILAARLIMNSVQTAGWTVSHFWSWSLPRGMEIDYGQDDRAQVAKFGFGLPGLVAGTAIGLGGYAVIGLSRVVWNSLRSFRDLSGGILNVAFERAIFRGMQNPTPHNNRWVLGSLGILSASIVTVALGLGIFGARKTVRVAVPLALGIIVSPLIALIRGARELWKYKTNQLRFSRINDKATGPLQKVKSLFAILTPWGALPENAAEQMRLFQEDNNDSPYYTQGFFKNLLKFVRKSITFNAQTLTEQVLSRFTDKLQGIEDQDAKLKPVIRATISEVIAHYKEDSDWITPQAEKCELEKEGAALGKILKKYVLKDDIRSLNAHYRGDSRIPALFFGAPEGTHAAAAENVQQPQEGVQPQSPTFS